MATAAQRLREALDLRGRSTRWLSLELSSRRKDRGQHAVKGSSYASVHSYLQPTGPTPGLEFLTAAADALKVRRQWLVHGDGHSADLQLERTGVLILSKWEGAEEQVKGLKSTIPTLGEVPAAVSTAFLELLRRYLFRNGPARVSRVQYCESAAELWKFVELPDRVRGFRASFTSEQFLDYALGMIHALLLAIPDPRVDDQIPDWRLHGAGSVAEYFSGAPAPAPAAKRRRGRGK